MSSGRRQCPTAKPLPQLLTLVIRDAELVQRRIVDSAQTLDEDEDIVHLVVLEHVVKVEVPGIVDHRPAMRSVLGVEDGVPHARGTEDTRKLEELEHVALARRAPDALDEVAPKRIRVVPKHLAHRALELEADEGVVQEKVLVEGWAKAGRISPLAPEVEEVEEELGDFDGLMDNDVCARDGRLAVLGRRDEFVLEPQAGV